MSYNVIDRNAQVAENGEIVSRGVAADGLVLGRRVIPESIGGLFRVATIRKMPSAAEMVPDSPTTTTNTVRRICATTRCGNDSLVQLGQTVRVRSARSEGVPDA